MRPVSEDLRNARELGGVVFEEVGAVGETPGAVLLKDVVAQRDHALQDTTLLLSRAR